MSAADVLAVMDAIDGWARVVSDEFIDGGEFRTEYARDLRASNEARAAVAKLIEAARDVAEYEHEPRFIYGAIRELRAALASATGGAK